MHQNPGYYRHGAKVGLPDQNNDGSTSKLGVLWQPKIL